MQTLSLVDPMSNSTGRGDGNDGSPVAGHPRIRIREVRVLMRIAMMRVGGGGGRVGCLLGVLWEVRD